MLSKGSATLFISICLLHLFTIWLLFDRANLHFYETLSHALRKLIILGLVTGLATWVATLLYVRMMSAAHETSLIRQVYSPAQIMAVSKAINFSVMLWVFPFVMAYVNYPAPFWKIATLAWIGIDISAVYLYLKRNNQLLR